jgi:hypothetical protein
MSHNELEDEASRATELLKGKEVIEVLRHRGSEMVIIFTDGTRLFVDVKPEKTELELSIT